MSDNKEYLVRGALLYCKQGTHPRRLNLPRCHGIYVGEHPIINADDCEPGKNLSYFGVCKSGTPPETSEVIRLAGYVVEGSGETAEDVQGYQCKPVIIGNWMGVRGKADISGKASAVTTDCYLICGQNGMIEPITSGQEFED